MNFNELTMTFDIDIYNTTGYFVTFADRLCSLSWGEEEAEYYSEVSVCQVWWFRTFCTSNHVKPFYVNRVDSVLP